MKIIVAGTGFVGLTHAAVCSEYGHEVYAYDIDERKLAAYRSADPEKINHYVNEPGLPGIIAENMDRYLFFCNDLEPIIEGTDAIFLCLPTPPNLDGSSDLSYYFKAVDHLCMLLAKRQDTRRVVLVNKSTVPVGTARQLERKLREYNVPNAGVASNPEFLPEGDAVEKSRRPDRVVIGADTEEDFRIIRRLYSQFVNHVRIRYIETTPETAESIKYVANTLLLTYISFWNGVGARLGETFSNVRMEDLKRGVTADNSDQHLGLICLERRGRLVFRQRHSVADLPAQDRRPADRYAAIGLQHQRVPEDLPAGSRDARGRRALQSQEGRAVGPVLQAAHQRHARCLIAESGRDAAGARRE